MLEYTNHGKNSIISWNFVLIIYVYVHWDTV